MPLKTSPAYLVAAFAMLGGMLILSAMDAMVKWLVLQQIHPFQIIAIRGLVAAVAMVLVFSFKHELHQIKPTRWQPQIIRGLSGIAAPASFFMALGYLPLTDAVVVFFTSVFAITIFSALLLKENVGRHRWTAVVLGYLGVVIAMKPDGDGSLAGYLLTLFSSLAYAGLFVSGRWLSKTESVSSLVFSFNLGSGLIACCLLPFIWSNMSPAQWQWVFLLTTFAVAGHYALTYAFSNAEASSIAPLEYSAIIWALMFDFFVWSSSPSTTTMLGALVVISSGMYVMHRENVVKRESNEQ